MNEIEQQIENIETQAEVESTPAFSFTQEMIDKALQDGTGHENGKFRVYRLYQETFSSKERQDFMKKEFNYYGTSGVKGLDGIWVEYSPSGVRIDIWTHFMRGCIIDYVH